jgi:hypothetical protein
MLLITVVSNASLMDRVCKTLEVGRDKSSLQSPSNKFENPSQGRNGYASSTDNVISVGRAPLIILESRSKPISMLTPGLVQLQPPQGDNQLKISHTFKSEGMNSPRMPQYFFCLKTILLAVALD